MTIDKIKHYLPCPVFNHISSLTKTELEAQKEALIKDMELISKPGYFAGNCNDLYFMRDIELKYINYRLN